MLTKYTPQAMLWAIGISAINKSRSVEHMAVGTVQAQSKEEAYQKAQAIGFQIMPQNKGWQKHIVHVNSVTNVVGPENCSEEI